MYIGLQLSNNTFYSRYIIFPSLLFLIFCNN